jgi:hypothetical protein
MSKTEIMKQVSPHTPPSTYTDSPFWQTGMCQISTHTQAHMTLLPNCGLQDKVASNLIGKGTKERN